MRNVVFLAVMMSMIWSPASWAGSEQASPQTGRHPNFLVIVADDMGFSDLGAFGGEISTPHLDAIAAQGIRLTNFRTAPTCSPTRAMLLTGQDPHRVGLGAMAEVPMADPRPQGYEGYLNAADTIADRLRGAGYATLMSGKWHLGTERGQWPEDHGFDRSFVLHQGGDDHYGLYQAGPWGETGMRTTYSKDGKLAPMPTGVYAGDYFTDRMLEFLQGPGVTDKPFFGYLAFTEPHWPLQAPVELIDKYRGRYVDGPTVLLAERFARMKERGLVSPGAMPPPATGPDWSSLSPDERARYSRAMEIYAAMVERIDNNVGRVLDELRRQERLDDTIILFMSDNGAEGQSWDEMKALLGWLDVSPSLATDAEAANRDMSRMGRPASFVVYGPQWARTAMAPFRLYKGSVNEGGIRAPAFVSGPGIVGNRTSDTLLSVRDVMPTLLRLAEIPDRDAEEEGGGRSWVPLLQGQADEVRRPEGVLVQEFMGRRMVLRQDGWKAVYSDPQSLGAIRDSARRWQLYQIRTDPSETQDLAATYPEILNELIEVWKRYAGKNNILEGLFDKSEGAQRK
eukprot:TRINITY_DN57176_c0_g1_i1.p1 TRINITY_DN57176_c0_g1~~TRINITY_DN57176_c0_g1_i1.p1  ORF type:complete len:567 (+),score=60.63 TRINITY_DN57176_c0_g1_i1:31-1731(+)